MDRPFLALNNYANFFSPPPTLMDHSWYIELTSNTGNEFSTSCELRNHPVSSGRPIVLRLFSIIHDGFSFSSFIAKLSQFYYYYFLKYTFTYS